MKELKLNKKEFDLFLEVAEELNKNFKIKPLIWGSLGLSLVIGEFKKVEDIDVLLPDIYIKNKWGDLKRLMEGLKFKLIDEKEHEFGKNKIKIAFAGYSDLFYKIPTSSLKVYSYAGSEFRNLSAEQYLKQYKEIVKIPYRTKTWKVKEDIKKIKLIEDFFKNGR